MYADDDYENGGHQGWTSEGDSDNRMGIVGNRRECLVYGSFFL